MANFRRESSLIGGPQDRSSTNEQAREQLSRELLHFLRSKQPFVTAHNADGFPAAALRRFGHGPDDGIEAGAISAAGNNTDSGSHLGTSTASSTPLRCSTG